MTVSKIPSEHKIKVLTDNIGKAFRGKPEVIRMALICLIAKGHLLIEDVPGVGKTTLAHALAASMNLDFRRIQFTSDLLPSDIIGISIYDQNKKAFTFTKGPIFSNIVLADEINRTTPRTQSCMLEAMNEGQVSVDNSSLELQKPFFVMATQNPMEFHGTYPLPESQLDRFLMRISVGYPDHQFEREIVTQSDKIQTVDQLKPVLNGQELLELQHEVNQVHLEESVVDYGMAIVRATRQSSDLAVGVSTRGALSLFRAARARALVKGRIFCTPHDLKQLALPVLAHRIMPGTGHTGLDSRGASENILEKLIAKVPLPV